MKHPNITRAMHAPNGRLILGVRGGYWWAHEAETGVYVDARHETIDSALDELERELARKNEE